MLTETRIVLPGVQAFLGFQLATMFMDGFERLSLGLKYVHLGALAAISVSMVLLIAPAAYHRLVEYGEDSEHFLRLAGRLLLAAMVFLALGTAADFYVVVEKVAQSTLWGLVSAGLALLLCYGLWFGYTASRRRRVGRPHTTGR